MCRLEDTTREYRIEIKKHIFVTQQLILEYDEATELEVIAGVNMVGKLTEAKRKHYGYIFLAGRGLSDFFGRCSCIYKHTQFDNRLEDRYLMKVKLSEMMTCLKEQLDKCEAETAMESGMSAMQV